MARKIKKELKATTQRTLFGELEAVRSLSPEEMMRKMGGVAGQIVHEQRNPLTQNPAINTAHSLGIDSSGSSAGTHLGGSFSGGPTIQQADYELGRGNQMIQEGHWSRAIHDFQEAAADFTILEAGGQISQNSMLDNTGKAFFGEAQAYQDDMHLHEALTAAKSACMQFEELAALTQTGPEFISASHQAASVYEFRAEISGQLHSGDTAELYQHAGSWYAEAQMYEKSGAAYSQAASLYDGGSQEQAHCLRLAGDNYLAAQDLGNAMTNFNEANAVYSSMGEVAQQGECNYGIGQIYMQQNHFHQAADAYHTAAQEFRSTQNTEEAKVAYEMAGKAYLSYGQSLASQAQNNEGPGFQQAVKEFQNAAHCLETSGGTSGETNDLIAQAYVAQANALMGIYNFSDLDVHNAYRSAARYYGLAANAFNSEGHFNQAGEADLIRQHDLLKAADYAINHQQAKADREVAAKAAEDAVHNFKDAGAADSAIAAADAGSGHYNSAAKAYENAAEAYAKAGDANDANTAWINAGNSFDSSAAADAAAGEYNRAASAYTNAANAYNSAGESSNAVTAYGNAATNFNLAAAKDAAEGHHNEAGNAYENAANSFAQAGNTADATTAWSNAGSNFDIAAHSYASLDEYTKAASEFELAAKAYSNAGNTTLESKSYEDAYSNYVSAAKSASTDSNACKFLVDAYNADYKALSCLPAGDQSSIWLQMNSEFTTLTTYFANHDSGWTASAYCAALAQGAQQQQAQPALPAPPDATS